MIEAENMSEPSDLDVTFQTILDVTARHVEHDRYVPVLEVITYDLETVSNVGTPAELRLEISQIEKYVTSAHSAENRC
jgi:hypothetical protein